MDHLKYPDGQAAFFVKLREQFPDVKFPLDVTTILLPLVIRHGDKGQEAFAEQHAQLLRDVAKRIDVAAVLSAMTETLKGEKQDAGQPAELAAGIPATTRPINGEKQDGDSERPA